MSDEFDRREESFEKSFAMGEEKRFRALARRNRALGLWAAETLGLSGQAAEAHADALVSAQISGRSEAAMAAALGEDFARAGVEMSAHRIRRKMEAAMAQAIADVRAGK